MFKWNRYDKLDEKTIVSSGKTPEKKERSETQSDCLQLEHYFPPKNDSSLERRSASVGDVLAVLAHSASRHGRS